MAAAQIIIEIDDANMTADVWKAFMELHPFQDPQDPPDVSTKALKLAYAGEALSRKLNEKLTDRVRVNAARAARDATAAVDLNAGG